MLTIVMRMEFNKFVEFSENLLCWKAQGSTIVFLGRVYIRAFDIKVFKFLRFCWFCQCDDFLFINVQNLPSLFLFLPFLPIIVGVQGQK